MSNIPFQHAAVIGAGVMGAGIAAILAEAGLAVILLDIDRERAAAGIRHQLANGGFSDPDNAKRIMPASMDEDIGLLAQADWIIEAAAERPEIKHSIFKAVEQARKTGSIVSSNTSTIPLSKMIEPMPARFASDFLIAHFFNPPRAMRLLEIVGGPDTRPGALAAVEQFATQGLNKVVVRCFDTPGFIANRIGNYWMATALAEAVAIGMDVELADAVIGKPFGAPCGIFALLDLIGIDLLPPAWRSLQAGLDKADPFQAFDPEPPVLARMIDSGLLGRKAGAGFTRRLPEGGMEVIDLATGCYRSPRQGSSGLPANDDLRAIMTDASPAGRYAANVWGRTLAYARSLVPEVVASPALADQAMRHGYGWKQGPFELIERIGEDLLIAP